MTNFDERAKDWDSDPKKVERARTVADAIRKANALSSDCDALRDKLARVLELLKDESTIVCPDCGGAGFWTAKSNKPSYVVAQPDGSYKVACERCGGDFDVPGCGVVATDEVDSVYARAVAIAEGRE